MFASVKKIYKQAKDVLEKGGLILIPTDTVIGIAADASNNTAIKNMNLLKGDAYNRVRQLIFSDIDQLYEYADVSGQLLKALNRLLPGPYTFIVNARKTYNLSKFTIKNGKIGVRIPKEQFLLDFVKFYGKPIAATSANLHGEHPVLTFKDVNPKIKQNIGFVLEKKGLGIPKLSFGKRVPYASGIIDLTTKPYKVLRKHPAVEKALKVLN